MELLGGLGPNHIPDVFVFVYDEHGLPLMAGDCDIKMKCGYAAIQFWGSINIAGTVDESALT